MKAKKRRAKKMYNYMASSVFLQKVPEEHRGGNGNCQFHILVRASSINSVADMLGNSCSARHLREYGGIHRLNPERDTDRIAIIKKDNTFYYRPEFTRVGYITDYCEYPTDFSDVIIWADHDREKLRRKSDVKKARFPTRPDEIPLSPRQLEALLIIWMRYGNNCWAHTMEGHKFIQGLIERGEDCRDLYKPKAEVIQKVDLILNDKFL